jgi:hypothetical protein
MPEKRMLIVDTELLGKIDANRGDLSRDEFIAFLIDSKLEESRPQAASEGEYVTREEFLQSQQGIKELLHSFLEFFLSYEMEVGKQPESKDFDDVLRKIWPDYPNKFKH